MRVVGYVRETADPDRRTAFAQQEMIRRHAAEHGMTLVAVCQDPAGSGVAAGRDGYRALLGVVESGGVDGVLVPGLETLSSDQIVQEIVLRDLRRHGVRVLSTEDDDLALLDAEQAPGPARMFIRDVLTRIDEHARAAGDGDPSVVIHLAPSEASSP